MQILDWSVPTFLDCRIPPWERSSLLAAVDRSA